MYFTIPFFTAMIKGVQEKEIIQANRENVSELYKIPLHIGN